MKESKLITRIAEIPENLAEKNIDNSIAAFISVTLGMSTKIIEFSNKNFEAFSKSYAWDFLSTFSIYNFISASGVIKNNYLNAGVAFGIPSLAEVLQNYNMLPGTYDPKDFIIYGLGAGIALGLDKTRKYISKNFHDIN